MGTDLELVRSALAGDEAATRELIARVHRYARKSFHELAARSPRIRGHEQDLLQRFQVMLLEQDRRALRTYEGRASLQAWVQIVATRFFIRNAPRDTGKETLVAGDELEDVSDPADTPEVREERRSSRQAVQRALAELPAQDRLLLALLFEQEVAAPDVGRALDLTPSGVRMRKQRLLKKLADRLKELKP